MSNKHLKFDQLFSCSNTSEVSLHSHLDQASQKGGTYSGLGQKTYLGSTPWKSSRDGQRGMRSDLDFCEAARVIDCVIVIVWSLMELNNRKNAKHWIQQQET